MSAVKCNRSQLGLSRSSQSTSKDTEVRPPRGSSRDCHLRAISFLTMTGWQESSHLVTYDPSQQILTACLGVGNQEIKWCPSTILAFYSLLWNQINTCMCTVHIKPYTCTVDTAHNSGKVPSQEGPQAQLHLVTPSQSAEVCKQHNAQHGKLLLGPTSYQLIGKRQGKRGKRLRVCSWKRSREHDTLWQPQLVLTSVCQAGLLCRP